MHLLQLQRFLRPIFKALQSKSLLAKMLTLNLMILNLAFLVTLVQGFGYVDSMRLNITHLQCYEGIDRDIIKRSCPAYSVTCSKVTICKNSVILFVND